MHAFLLMFEMHRQRTNLITQFQKYQDKFVVVVVDVIMHGVICNARLMIRMVTFTVSVRLKFSNPI